MLSAFLLGKQEVVPLPRTATEKEDGLYFDDDIFFRYVEELRARPRSNIMFERLYQECKSLVHHHKTWENFLRSHSSVSLDIKDDLESIEIFRDTSFILGKSDIDIHYGTGDKERWMRLHKVKYLGENLPARLGYYNGKLDLINEYFYGVS
ncbi:hypothetical protein HNV12_02630 [Methanococcoides sp. SA1]|nr:hypothetical protein [Methanococcoides sp. SA1]